MLKAASETIQPSVHLTVVMIGLRKTTMAQPPKRSYVVERYCGMVIFGSSRIRAQVKALRVATNAFDYSGEIVEPSEELSPGSYST
jgi:hypothetical protein